MKAVNMKCFSCRSYWEEASQASPQTLCTPIFGQSEHHPWSVILLHTVLIIHSMQSCTSCAFAPFCLVLFFVICILFCTIWCSCGTLLSGLSLTKSIPDWTVSWIDLIILNSFVYDLNIPLVMIHRGWINYQISRGRLYLLHCYSALFSCYQSSVFCTGWRVCCFIHK